MQVKTDYLRLIKADLAKQCKSTESYEAMLKFILERLERTEIEPEFVGYP